MMNFYGCSEEMMEERRKEEMHRRLRFIQNFYITTIETKRRIMNEAHNSFLRNRDDMKAYQIWTGDKIKIVRLYECWLRELEEMKICHDDPKLFCMHRLMIADCYWFLATTSRPAFTSSVSNFEMAVRSLEEILELIEVVLPSDNAFFRHIVDKYCRLVEDYTHAMGEPATRSAPHRFTSTLGLMPRSSRVPMNMFERDVNRLRKATANSQKWRSLTYGHSNRSLTNKMTTSSLLHKTAEPIQRLTSVLHRIL